MRANGDGAIGGSCPAIAVNAEEDREARGNARLLPVLFTIPNGESAGETMARR